MNERLAPNVRNWITILVLLLGASVLQVALISRFGIGGSRPDLVMLVIVMCGLLSTSVRGAIVGCLGGLIVSIAAASEPGVHAFVGTIVGYWCGRWGELLVTDDHPAPPVAMALLGSISFSIGTPLVASLVAPARVSPELPEFMPLVLSAGLDAALAIPVFLMVRRLLVVGVSLRGREART